MDFIKSPKNIWPVLDFEKKNRSTPCACRCPQIPVFSFHINKEQGPMKLFHSISGQLLAHLGTICGLMRCPTVKYYKK